MSNRHLMVDIETLSTRPDAAVIAIGVAVFNRVEIIDTHQWLISPEWAIGHREERTKREFWSNPERVTPEVQAKMFSGKRMPWDIASEFTQFYETYKSPQIWANPPQFDLIILRNMYDACDMIAPWHYRAERDCRSVFAMGKSLGVDYSGPYRDRGDSAHDAEQDAITQARVLQIIWDRVLA